jgi:hypothetical protein
MSHLTVLSLGNLETESEPPPQALAILPQDGRTRIIQPADVAAALTELRTAEPATTLRCTPDLASVAVPLGYEVAPWTEEILAERATLALLLCARMPFEDITDRTCIDSIIRATARLIGARKDRDRFWRIEVSLRGTGSSRALSAAVSVIASTSAEPDQTNVTIFTSKADSDAYLRGVTESPLTPPPIGYVTLSPNPPYTHALRTTFQQYTHQEWTPSVAVNDGTNDRNLTDLEAMILAAVTFAITELAEDPDQLQRETVFAQAGTTLVVTCSAQVSAPASSTFHGIYGWWR